MSSLREFVGEARFLAVVVNLLTVNVGLSGHNPIYRARTDGHRTILGKAYRTTSSSVNYSLGIGDAEGYRAALHLLRTS
jgi:hypothetical protein